MTEYQQERSKILLKATLDILNKCNRSPRVENVLETTAIWDQAECDGYCLRDELKILLEDINHVRT